MEVIYVFTDGSCNPAHRTGAWACIILHGSEKKTFTGFARDTTHQRMELASVINGLLYIKSHRLNENPVIIYTDSQYVTGLPDRTTKLLASDFKTKKNHTLPNADLLNEMFGYLNELNVTFIKVKAHQKSSFEERMNSEADRLCRQLVRFQVQKIEGQL